MGDEDGTSRQDRWAHFRLSVIGGLLASPPARGELQQALREVASRRYRHPIHGDWITVSQPTAERWYYLARDAADPVAALRRKIRSDAGRTTAMSPDLLAALKRQYLDHPRWSYQLHADNLAALVHEHPQLGPSPSYTTVRRRMRERAWVPRRPRGPKGSPGREKAWARLQQREVRAYEASHVHGLWHFDFHEGRRRVVDGRGEWHTPQLLGILDDRSRMACHLQWYLAETAETLVHGLEQGFAKRGLPRAAMSDNGGAMLAQETVNGLQRFHVPHETTLPYSPYQNAKQEFFWSVAEGRLMAMLESVDPLSLSFLNLATQAWVELEYNRGFHTEIGTTPLKRLLAGPDASRPCPEREALRVAFACKGTRTQRHSDGTISIEAVRFEVPSRLRHLRTLHVRYRRWDLSVVHLVDPRTEAVLARIHPVDKARNADRRRRALQPVVPGDAIVPPPPDPDPLPPLMRRLLAEYAATGLPPGYLPKEEHGEATAGDDHEPSFDKEAPGE